MGNVCLEARLSGTSIATAFPTRTSECQLSRLFRAELTECKEVHESEEKSVSDQENHPSDGNKTRSVAIPSDGNPPLQDGTILSADWDKTQNYVETTNPTSLGRYTIEELIGSGGFGTVYRVWDDQLQRSVAVKLPHLHRIHTEEERRAYLSEARTVAGLDHPGIVPVYDFGVLSDGRCFVVSKLIQGRNLAQLLVGQRYSVDKTVRILIDVANTLNYIHHLKLIHRDIKPSNLLIDHDDRVYVVDFGLALHESEAVTHRSGAGTPSYMSPEQAGGEGHLIDSRTDLYSLGAVMYEMLAGVRPIIGGSFEETRRLLLSEEPVSLLERDSTLPAELNRICLKLLSKRASDRYPIAAILIDDLKHFQSHERSTDSATATEAAGASSVKNSNQFVPRGLRAYDRHDAYFFMRLLPGPFDRDGIPESVSHWRRWVLPSEESPENQRFGVIAGPSGCGKSSLIRAGLVPLLDRNVVSTIIMEATIDRTETQLAMLLDSRFPDLSEAQSLTDKLSAIRRGKGLAAGKKLVIVIDQFEQWLHSVHELDQAELVRALRQCDGVRLQCIVLVRDDFWLALNRFMEAVEAPLNLGQNVKMVDLFDQNHAKVVLTQLGQAYGRLPELPLSVDAKKFIEQGVSYLAQDGKVFPVHLSLFVEMVKARDWIPHTLSELGGAVGVGVRFLQESFSAAHAPMQYRLHETGIRATLEGLLPEVGTLIKTRHRTLQELRDLSGYGDDTKRFDSLMTILEGQLKLISPVDTFDHSRTSVDERTSTLHYQLSHDFLVPSIREWLFSEHKKTYTGRCRLMLADQSVIWNKQPIHRHLPLWRDWIQYRLLLRTSTLREPEKRMLASANRVLGLQTLIGALLAIVMILAVEGFRSWNQVHALISQLRTTNVSAVPAIVQELLPHRWLAPRLVKGQLHTAKSGTTEAVNLRLAQIHWEPEAAEPLMQYAINTGDSRSLLVIRESLQPYRDRCVDECWQVLESGPAAPPRSVPRQRAFRAAMLLARLDPPTPAATSSRWLNMAPFLSEEVVDWVLRSPDDYRVIVDGMLPLAELLTPSLSLTLGQPEPSDRSRSQIALLRSFHEGEDQRLTSMLVQGSKWQWDDLKPAIKRVSPEWLRPRLSVPRDTSSPEAELRWERQVAASAALLLSIAPDERSWGWLRRDPNPGIRSLLIERIAYLGVPLAVVEQRFIQEGTLAEQADPGLLSGLLLAIAEFPEANSQLTEPSRSLIRQLYEMHPDSGVHSAAGWIMDHIGMPVNPAKLATSGVNGRAGFQWRVTPQGHVMVRFDARNEPEIGRIFELCTTEVSVRQYQAFHPYKYYSSKISPNVECPVNIVKWPEALNYCNWLSSQHGLSEDNYCCPAGPPGESFEQQLTRLNEWSPDQDTSYMNRRGYRIPTQAEWAFACAAGAKSRWYFGIDPTLVTRYAWCVENALGPGSTGAVQTHPSGQLGPNEAGLFDMYGNVVEWSSTREGTGLGVNRLFVMGGSYAYEPSNLTNRSTRSTPTNTEFDSLGFRIARTVSESDWAP